jgi:3-isopropylmalate/(R)-2-methylmalate dehydratase small subunit
MSETHIKKGKAFKFGDNISTDHIAPGRLFHLRNDLVEFSKHVLEDADETFASRVQKGDFVVAGNNFGLGSSREHAPQIIKIAGVGAVIAKSFARIFYRNAINIGLLAIECDTDKIDAGDELELDIKQGILKDLTKNIELKIMPLPDVMIKLLEDGGLVEHLNKNGDFKLV